MREPIISDLLEVDEEIINALKIWLKNVKRGKWEGDSKCPFENIRQSCNLLFENLSPSYCGKCPCFRYGEGATILAFTIICDVWKEYHKKGNTTGE